MIKIINAKLNIGLNIVNRRPDGYHDLETVFYPVGVLNGTPENPEPFCDILECDFNGNREGIEYQFRGRVIDCPPEKNLVVRAGELFAEELAKKGVPLLPHLRVTLEKHLPDGAGLGGGSADATFVLTTLNELHANVGEAPFSDEELERMALRLGADCPVFVRNRPAYAEGVGERLQTVELDLTGWWCVIAKPPVYVSTKEAFAGITPRRPDENLRHLITLPVEEWRGRVKNDFEDSIFPQHPELAELKESLYESGAAYVAMSGSGSSIFALMRDRDMALDAVKRLPAQTLGTVCLLTK